MADTLVLLVEDDADTREMYRMVLSSVGYNVVPADNGSSALDAVAGSMPDIVVTDLAMPGMDGFELTRALRANPATKSVPIIAVTGQAVPATPGLAAQAGCCCLFNKPFLPDALLDAINAMLNSCSRSCCETQARETCPSHLYTS